ncbi:N-acetyltransferase GCN5 [Cellulomonas denverensis]|nr:N-acetyltransferase GCN5 [Cellulomonas denverensis]
MRDVVTAAGPGVRSGPGTGRVLGDEDLPAALAVCGLDPVASVLATVRLEQAARIGLRRTGGHLWGYQVDGLLVAICWSGANLVPVIPALPDVDPARAALITEHALEAFGAFGRAQGRRCSSIVGEAPAALGLWDRLRPAWGHVREVRDDQPSMVLDHDPAVAPDPQVRLSRPEEFDALLPACVQMFTEEVGYSPLAGSGGAYEARVRGLIRDRRSYVRMDADGRVVFKAELGAVAGGVAQVQGVWVRPDRRGAGLSEAGMAAVVAQTRREVAPVVSLYANAYNARAMAAYRKVGFRQVGTFATVLF